MGWKLEALLIGGMMVVIVFILVTLNHLVHVPGINPTTIAEKLVGQLHVLEGVLIAWGTQIVTVITGSMTSKLQATRLAKENENDESRIDQGRPSV